MRTTTIKIVVVLIISHFQFTYWYHTKSELQNSQAVPNKYYSRACFNFRSIPSSYRLIYNDIKTFQIQFPRNLTEILWHPSHRLNINRVSHSLSSISFIWSPLQTGSACASSVFLIDGRNRFHCLSVLYFCELVTCIMSSS